LQNHLYFQALRVVGVFNLSTTEALSRGFSRKLTDEILNISGISGKVKKTTEPGAQRFTAERPVDGKRLPATFWSAAAERAAQPRAATPLWLAAERGGRQNLASFALVARLRREPQRRRRWRSAAALQKSRAKSCQSSAFLFSRKSS
jgi:hypothetical protein